MVHPFQKLHLNSRLWIYSADRKIQEDEKDSILNECTQFLMTWAAHGSEIKASANILEDHFLIIAADESFQMASGCSIDSAVQFVQQLSKKYQIDFFDRTNLYFEIDDRIKLVKLNEINEFVNNGSITPNTIFFNTNIYQFKELNSNWRVKAEESWVKRYFKAPESV